MIWYICHRMTRMSTILEKYEIPIVNLERSVYQIVVTRQSRTDILGLTSNIIKYALNNNLDRLQLLLLLLCFERQIIKVQLAGNLNRWILSTAPRERKIFLTENGRKISLFFTRSIEFRPRFSTREEERTCLSRGLRAQIERGVPAFESPRTNNSTRGRVTKTRSRRKQARDARAYTRGAKEEEK